jgi:hypothetical protein
MLEFAQNFGKPPLTNKSNFDNWIPSVSAHCTFPYFDRQLIPVHNSDSRLIRFRESEFLSIDFANNPSTHLFLAAVSPLSSLALIGAFILFVRVFENAGKNPSEFKTRALACQAIG